MSAAAMAAQSAVTAIREGIGKPGRNWEFSPASRIWLASSVAVRPEGDLVAAAAVERERDGGSPCAGT